MVKRIVAFGDSFSDNGFSNGCGYNRLSNGKVWVEHLADMLGVELEDRAWCGAQSGLGNASGPKDWSGLNWQVQNFKPQGELGDTLCTVLIGINDIYDGSGSTENVVENSVIALERLVDKGVRHLLVSNVPNITHAPAYAGEYAACREIVLKKVHDINALLEPALFASDGFAHRHPEVTLHRVKAWDVFECAVEQGRFTRLSEPWNGTYAFPEADGYMWWDDWHPMTAMHRIFAQAALEELGRESGR
ncbi:SGNH/GDSL hydrolase family protein [Pseudodesulfovibrio tunisiensis]|uniref:SGNH/GDSL hydrolase family protein n=1 Tax=Pseudodesulfovibrio tunisiensis TaxID=463192 RepID=UPI001FB1F8EA|nr:SGNH/GDSL hydrolase family protein [Pseudodesulfovibrio tunisiensis]